jgi:hypothetical protein
MRRLRFPDESRLHSTDENNPSPRSLEQPEVVDVEVGPRPGDARHGSRCSSYDNEDRGLPDAVPGED